MDSTIKKTILSALSQAHGDDLYRMQAATRGWTPEQMSKQWGQSGQTAQEIMDAYVEHSRLVNAAREWVSGQ